MGIKVTNNAETTLASSISAVATSITVATGDGALFPTLAVGDYFYATLEDSLANIEIVKVTARSVDAMTIVRAQEGTTARSWSAGDVFELRATAQTVADLVAEEVGTGYVSKTGNTGSAEIPVGTQAQRDGTPAAGYFRFNTDSDKFEGYNGTAWGSVGGGATGGGQDDAFYENTNTITTSYTITSGKNAMTAGPITINSGVTVSIPSGSTWTII